MSGGGSVSVKVLKGHTPDEGMHCSVHATTAGSILEKWLHPEANPPRTTWYVDAYMHINHTLLFSHMSYVILDHMM